VIPAVTRDPETMRGVPVFRRTRVPVQTLFDYLEGGDTLEDFLGDFQQYLAFWLSRLWKKPSNCRVANAAWFKNEVVRINS
jgi:uncharacterized protein (DUF433 family)